jgi:hypothetical protein
MALKKSTVTLCDTSVVSVKVLNILLHRDHREYTEYTEKDKIEASSLSITVP